MVDVEFAQELCSEAEFKLYTESRTPLIDRLDRDQLRRRVSRARKLCALWITRAGAERRREKEAHGSKRTRAHTGHVCAQQKADLFGEALTRFDRRLAGLKKGDPTLMQSGESESRERTSGREVSKRTTRKLNRVMARAREAHHRQEPHRSS